MWINKMRAVLGSALAAVATVAGAGEVRIETVPCLGLPHCLRLSNGEAEVVVTTDAGPRIVRYALRDGENILGEVPDAVTKTDLGEWKALGGHRLWHAPEAMPRTYAPDNAPVRYETAGGRVTLRQPVEAATGIEKTMTVSLAASGTGVTITHSLTNRGLWEVELSPWALTILRGGGTAILPQEPHASHAQSLLPVRAMALWAYTDLADPRFSIGPRYVRLRADAAGTEPQKIGLGNRQGWAAYASGGTVFVKRFPYRDGAMYPDYGSNCEVYTQGTFIEVETLGPLARLRPGEGTEHVETWELFGGVDLAAAGTDAALERALLPLLKR